MFFVYSLFFDFFFFFFFQAEDGIRDYKVTGVQTCALPICIVLLTESGKQYYAGEESPENKIARCHRAHYTIAALSTASGYSYGQLRSEERRVGKECRSKRWTEA